MDLEHSSLAPGEAQAIVRRVGVDHALVIGDPATVRRFGETELRLPAAMIRVVGAMVAAAPGLAGMAADAGGHVVRLTEQSMTLLNQHGGLVGGDGALLGVVKAADGKFAGVLSFEAIGPMAQLAPGLPVLLSALAVQAQLVAIERKLDDIQADIGTLIRHGHIEVLAETRAALEILDDVHGDVIANGRLTDGDWERAARLELAVRTLHQRAGAHLRDLDRILADVDGGLGNRLQTLRRATRHDQVGFWFETYVVAETAIAKWDFLRLVRLATTEAPHLEREVAEAEHALRERREFVVGLSRRLTAYLTQAGRIDGVLQRIRIIARGRLERLILELDDVLAAYREWVPASSENEGEEEATIALAEGVAAALPPAPEDELWSRLVAETRMRSASLVGRAGDLAVRASTTITEAARSTVERAGHPIERGDDGLPDPAGDSDATE